MLSTNNYAPGPSHGEGMLRELLSTKVPPDTQANRIWFAQYAIACALVADRIGLFDRCHALHPTPLTELAVQLNVDEEALFRLCRVLHGRELLSLNIATRAIELTAQSRCYWRRDSLLYRGAQFEEVRPEGGQVPEPYHQARITRMLYEGRDRPRSEKGNFSDMWEAGEMDADAAPSYNEFMRTQSFSVAIAAVRLGAFTGVEHLVDLGGGSASFALTVKSAQPETRCSIFDLPEVCAASRSFLAGFPNLAVELFAGSFFGERWPEGVDAFSLSNILHDWSPGRCSQILRNAFAHLAPGGRLVLSEVLFDDDLLGPESASVFDLLMYMGHDAQQFSFAQLEHLVRGAGFAGFECRGTCGDYSILVAHKS